MAQGTSELSITGRLGLLEQRLSALREEVSTVDRTLQKEISDRAREIDTLRHDLRMQVAHLDTTLRTHQERSEEIDAHALPIVAWGLVLSEFPDWLVKVPMLAVIAFSIGMALLITALHLLGVKRKPSTDN